jgi:hypothetical protein
MNILVPIPMQLNRIKSITGSIRKKNTLKNYEFLFTRFSDEFSDRELESITPDEILSFLTRLTEGNKQTTKRNRYTCLKAFFVNGKQKRVKRPPTIDGIGVDEFIRKNADPIWLHQKTYFCPILRKKAGTDDAVPALIESEVSSKEFRKNWARRIQKIYHVDPLLCPKCLGSMKIISFIEDEDVISKILKHLGLWEVKQRPPPRAKAPPRNIHIDYTVSQIPSYEDDLYCDPDYPIEMYAS